MTMAPWIGQPLKRAEDPRLLTGRGVFVADLPVKNPYAAAILRSPHAHARIRSIDATAALSAPGVAGAITGADVLAHTQPFAVGVEAPVKYYCLATDKARLRLGWEPRWNFIETVEATVDWYKAFERGESMTEWCDRQIDQYQEPGR